MKMAVSPAFSLLFFLFISSTAAPAAKIPSKDGQDLVHSSCVNASYPDICLRTLSTYTGPAKTPRDLAKAAVKVSLSRTRKASSFLTQLKTKSNREQAALKDCVSQIGDSVDELSKSLSELKNLRRGTALFRWQMSNVETWVSAALTDEDSCLDGLKEVDSHVRADVNREITNVARVTSNALYFVTRLDN